MSRTQPEDYHLSYPAKKGRAQTLLPRLGFMALRRAILIAITRPADFANEHFHTDGSHPGWISK